MFKNLLVKIILSEVKFDWKYQVKRGGQEPWRPFQFNQLLANLQSHKEQNQRVYFTQKIRNPKFRQLISRMTGKVDSKRQKLTQNKATNRIDRFRRFHQN